jgi:glucosyl-3-phosphoglycerate synthase
VQFVKGFYRRPFRGEHGTLPMGGGRVTQLTALQLIAALLLPASAR